MVVGGATLPSYEEAGFQNIDLEQGTPGDSIDSLYWKKVSFPRMRAGVVAALPLQDGASRHHSRGETASLPRQGNLRGYPAMASYSPNALLCLALLLGCPLLPALDKIENSGGHPAGTDSLPADSVSPLGPLHTLPANSCSEGSAPNCLAVSPAPNLRGELEDIGQELRNEVLALREKTVDWWLTATAIFLALITFIFVVFGTFGGFLIRKDMESNLSQAKDILAEMKEMRAGAREAKREMDYANATLRRNLQPAPTGLEDTGEGRDAPLQDSPSAKAREMEDSGDLRGAAAEWHKVLEDPALDSALQQQALRTIGYLEGKVAELPDITPEERKAALLRALSAHDKSLSLTADDATVLVNRGQVRGKLGRYDEAMEDFLQAIKLDSGKIAAIAYSNLGSIKGSMGDHQEAVKDFDQAIGLDPYNAMAYSNRGGAKSELGKHREAISDFDRAVDLDPDLAMAYNNRGSAKGRLDMHQEAIEDFTLALEKEPKLATAYSNRGIAKRGLGKHADAVKDMREALRLAEAQGYPQSQQIAERARMILAEWGEEG